MTKQESRMKRAERIAEYEGFNELDYYSSFDGLMPIVERVNSEKTDNCIEVYSHCVIVSSINNTHLKTALCKYKQGTLIDALQRAIIFYHKNKGK